MSVHCVILAQLVLTLIRSIDYLKKNQIVLFIINLRSYKIITNININNK